MSEKADENADSTSVHIIYDEGCENDRTLADSLCRDILHIGITSTNFQQNGRAERPEMLERGQFIMSATWIVIICSKLQVQGDDGMFSSEENMALFVAVCTNVHKVIYLLSPDVQTIASKGFNFVSMSKNGNWFSEMKRIIRTKPVKISAKMFHHFYCQLSVLKNGLQRSMPVFASTMSQARSEDILLTWTMKGSQGCTVCVFKVCGDSVDLISMTTNGEPRGYASEEVVRRVGDEEICLVTNADHATQNHISFISEDTCPSSTAREAEDVVWTVDDEETCLITDSDHAMVTRLSSTPGNDSSPGARAVEKLIPAAVSGPDSLSDRNSTDAAETESHDIPTCRSPTRLISQTVLDNIAWSDVKNVRVDVQSTGISRMIGNVVGVMWYVTIVALLGLLMSMNIHRWITVPIVLALVAVLSVSTLLSMFTIFCSFQTNTKDFTLFSIYVTVLTSLFLLTSILYFVDPKTSVADVPYAIVILLIVCCVVPNYLALLCYFFTFDGCLTLYGSVLVLCVQIVYLFVMCLKVPFLAKGGNVSYKKTLVIMTAFFAANLGLYKFSMQLIAYVLKQRSKLHLLTIFEKIIIFLLILVWFGPSFLIVPENNNEFTCNKTELFSVG